jgi:hypothetical protein
MEDIVEQKGIEKINEPVLDVVDKEVVEKKRKPRSEAQKAAFEKARKKRAENLAKKKLEEEEEVSIDETENQTQDPIPAPPGVDANSPVVRPKAPVKKRGRPKGSKKLKREPEPVLGQPNFLPRNIPPEAGDIRYGYQQPQYQFNPFMYQQQFQPPPQVHNYYYGHQPAQPHPNNPPLSQTPQRPQTPEVESSSEEEVEQYIEYPQDTYQAPSLKYRFA